VQDIRENMLDIKMPVFDNDIKLPKLLTTTGYELMIKTRSTAEAVTDGDQVSVGAQPDLWGESRVIMVYILFVFFCVICFIIFIFSYFFVFKF